MGKIKEISLKRQVEERKKGSILVWDNWKDFNLSRYVSRNFSIYLDYPQTRTSRKQL